MSLSSLNIMKSLQLLNIVILPSIVNNVVMKYCYG